MRVLVTGGTGFIGSAVVKDLISAGHEVIGLARTNASAERLKSFGATPCEGSLEDVDGLKDMAKSAESVIHMAFAHDFANFGEAAEKDIRAIQALGEGLAIQATNNPFVVTSGVPLGVIGQVATEEVDSDKDFPRKSEAAALPFADCGVRVSIVRPSRFVHGIGDLHGFIPQL
ncbi:MAG: NAD-dependent epimerase/dehydratase family protein, partial [Clostridiales bacterium]|nr:NAD-dependent epimerase/dehydratase family protein [Clostridiales bacterium]